MLVIKNEEGTFSSVLPLLFILHFFQI